MLCRFCQHPLSHECIDLGTSPPSNAFLEERHLDKPEIFYPLKLFVCERCYLVQIEEHKKSEEIFDEHYPYFSSYSSSWLTHAETYARMIIDRLSLNASSHVMEIGSNDGYLLKHFVDGNIPCLGIEPSGTAGAARAYGIEVVEHFFNTDLALQLRSEGRKADLVIGNNVLAHVPDINDFVEGLRIILKDEGTITMEFPHVMRLVQENQFDTIYHEHFSYLSLQTVRRIFAAHHLDIFDVDELTTHGGSLRIYACHAWAKPTRGERILRLLEDEQRAGMTDPAFYKSLQGLADRVKNDLLAFLIEQHRAGHKVVGFGAAAKGNTLLNYCGVRRDLIPFVVDSSPHKQGMYLPGSRIPILTEEDLQRARPDFVLILPWNIQVEIVDLLSYIREWGGAVRHASSAPKDIGVRADRAGRIM